MTTEPLGKVGRQIFYHFPLKVEVSSCCCCFLLLEEWKTLSKQQQFLLASSSVFTLLLVTTGTTTHLYPPSDSCPTLSLNVPVPASTSSCHPLFLSSAAQPIKTQQPPASPHFIPKDKAKRPGTTDNDLFLTPVKAQSIFN